MWASMDCRTSEQPRKSLDLTMTYAIRGSRIKLSLENLVDEDVRFEQQQAEIQGVTEAGRRVTHSTHRGRVTSLSISKDLGSRNPQEGRHEHEN